MSRGVDFQLLMALSLYINSITANPPHLVPATPEMLFGSDFNKDQDLESEYEEEDEDEEEVDEDLDEAEVPSTPEDEKSVAWTRISELNDSAESLQRLPEVTLVEPV